MVLISVGVGLFLMVMGVRLMMVRNSLKASRPSNVRLKQLEKEWKFLLPLGFVVFLIGFFSPLLQVSVELAKSIANTGGVLFGLGIPQFAQWKLGQGTEDELKKSEKQLEIEAWFITIIGFVLVLVPPSLGLT